VKICNVRIVGRWTYCNLIIRRQNNSRSVKSSRGLADWSTHRQRILLITERLHVVYTKPNPTLTQLNIDSMQIM